MEEATVLLVEGKSSGNNSLAPALEKANYALHIVHVGAKAVSWMQENHPDIIVFDASAMRSSGSRSTASSRSYSIKPVGLPIASVLLFNHKDTKTRRYQEEQ